jgi:predicted Zn-dependent protease
MAKKVSLKGKKSYATYKATSQYEKNAKKKLQRHLKKFPNDECAKNALTHIEYRRQTPKDVSGWCDRKIEAYQGLGRVDAMKMAQILKHVRKVNNEGLYDKSVQAIQEKLKGAKVLSKKPINKNSNKSKHD